MAVTVKARKYTNYEGVVCPLCDTRLPVSSLQTGEQFCRSCKGAYEGMVFTPPVRKARVKHIAESGPSGATACARHERNAAAANCERCGNFMCNLCRIDADGMALCPPCFERLSEEGALPSSAKSFKNYAGMAGSLAVLGIPFMIFAALIGPLGIFYSVKGLAQKREMGESDGMIMLWLVLILCILETGLGLFFIAGIFGAIR